jgi:apolipoprotein N-acyltransferase
VAGGVAGALAFEPLGWRWLIPLAPLGCFLAIRWAPSARGAFLRALVFGWIFYFGTLHWLLTIRVYAPVPILGILGVALLGVYLGLYLAIIGFVLRRWL